MHERSPLVRLFRRLWLRRVLLAPAALVMAAAGIAAAPALLAAAAIGDALRGRRRLPWLRTTAFLITYAAAEAMGMLAAAVIWLGWRRRPEYLALNYAIGQRWSRLLFSTFCLLFEVELTTAGADELARGPLFVFPRHVSLADTILPMVLAPPSQRPRFVMKAALRLDPILDLLGGRTPNAFVERGIGGTAVQVARVASLADDLGPRDIVVLFPEGTRFTPGRRSRRLLALERTGAAAQLAAASALQCTLPPHTGGPLALLERRPDVDAAFCAHTGLEGLTHLRDLFSGEMIGRRIHVQFWRIPASQIPSDADARKRWLLEQWSALDRWLQVSDRALP